MMDVKMAERMVVLLDDLMVVMKVTMKVVWMA